MRIYAVIAALILSIPSRSYAQIYGSNSMEFQLGNLPFQTDRDYTSSYDQLHLNYDSGYLSLYGRFELFDTPISERDYGKLTQRRIQFQDDHFRVRVGNFYETLGRGLLLRSYDIPGSVYEDAFQRQRYAFFRDLEGVSVDYIDDRFELKALRAQTLLNLLPPGFEPDSLRRPDLVEAIQASFYATDALNVGAILMRTNGTTGNFREYVSTLLDFNLNTHIQLFGEYAFETSSSFSLKDEDSFGLYGGFNFYSGSWGGSLEYKKYQNLRLGSGFNDPPSLIKEHTYPLLNRSTHVLDTSGEQGFQAETYYNFDAGHALTMNITRAVNDGFIRFEYTEIFLEGLYVFTEDFSLKSFFDYANDDLKAEENRISMGLITNYTFLNSRNAILDIQYQQFKREFDAELSRNFFSSIALSFQRDLVTSLIFEASTDPQQTDNPNTFPNIESEARFWLGANISWKVNAANTLELFGGKRRGGPACTSGICYEILDFEGVEARFTTRF